jgi:hypothetical protein
MFDNMFLTQEIIVPMGIHQGVDDEYVHEHSKSFLGMSIGARRGLSTKNSDKNLVTLSLPRNRLNLYIYT